MYYRGHRFLIDKIDQKLGSTEKELKFDKIAIMAGLLVMMVSAILLFICIESKPVLGLSCGLFFFFGLCFSYTMVKEYIDDKKKLN